MKSKKLCFDRKLSVRAAKAQLEQTLVYIRRELSKRLAERRANRPN